MILLVEDEPKLAAFIKQGLSEAGYEIKVAIDGKEGKIEALSQDFELIILDILLPHFNGIEICKSIRDSKVQTPVLMLTALGMIDDKVKAFESGADDYLTKPFDFKELLARVKVLLKRKSELPNISSKLIFGEIEMDLNQKTVKRSGQKVELTSKEFYLLEFFIKNHDKVVSRAEIAQKVWDIHFDTGTNVIDVYVNFLRKKIDKDFNLKYIHTVVGMGYIFRNEA